MMEAIVLAGGFGTRLRQVITAVPKPMALIRGKPFLEILLAMLAAKKVQRVVVGYPYRVLGVGCTRSQGGVKASTQSRVNLDGHACLGGGS